jgi:hypothetical protein
MNLRDIHDNPKLLAEFLQVPFEPTTRPRSGYYSHRYRTTETVTAEERTQSAFAAYRNELNAAWNKSKDNQFKAQTWTQVVAECIRKEFGFKTGTVASRIELAKMHRPDLYETVAA